MRRIISAISVLALAFSLVASATSANAAVAGYDSAYAGESAFLTLAPGQTGSFTVFFANTGTTSWVRGTGSQVDLAACLENKTTCNAQDATEAPFNSGWLSATRYTTHSQTTVAPGQIGTFTYNVAVPAGTAAGTYRFNGALVLSSTGADIRNEGYYQDVTVAASATTGTAGVITSISPTSGSTAGGTTVTVTGTGFTCTPAFPTVNFGTTAGTVTSCGATSLVVTSPAGAAGSTTLTVTNAGAPASNGVTYVYADTTRPTYNSVTVAGTIATVTFSEAVCRTTAWAAGDWNVTVNGVNNDDTGDSIPTCNSTFTNGVTTANVFLTTAAANGAFVAVTLETLGGDKMRDTAGNTTVAPRSNTTNAGPADATRPTIASTSGNGGSTTLTLNFSEPVYCGDGNGPDASDISVTTGTTTILSTDTDTCPTTAATAATSFTVTLASALVGGTSYSVTYTTVGADEVQDVTGNDLASPSSSSFVSGATDSTPPTLTDTRIVTNAGLTTNMDSGDVFTITFSEAMNTHTGGDTIQLQDTDNGSAGGDTGTITCGTNATCTFNTAGTVVTVTITTAVVCTTPPANTSTVTCSYPATITGLGGFADAGNNAPNVAGSADRVIDQE